MKEKRLIIFVVIVIIIISLVGCSVSQENVIQQNNNSINKQVKLEVSDLEKKSIDEYIDSIYGYYGVFEDVFPEFKDINQAPENWLWGIVWKNIGSKAKYNKVEYIDIETEMKNIFGNDLKKNFPKEGLEELLVYDEQSNDYFCEAFGLDVLTSSYIIDKIEKYDDKYIVEIVEYIADYEECSYGDFEEGDDVNIKLLDCEKNFVYKHEFKYGDETSYDAIIEYVKENKDKFSSKKVKLKFYKEDETLHVVSIEKS